jgi:phage N-6-adenine-methyltransferase
MAMVRFKPVNHPQQTDVRGAVDDTDDRRTPDCVFDPLHDEHHFSIDVAASAQNHRLPRYFDREADGLAQPWTKERVWCNPPYSNLYAWVKKALYEVAHGCWKVVMLLPANRTEQRWWQELIEPIRDRGLGVTTRNLSGRPKFQRPGGEQILAPGKGGNRPPFGCVVVVIEPCPRCCGTEHKGAPKEGT